jgi:hypothetical protein
VRAGVDVTRRTGRGLDGLVLAVLLGVAAPALAPAQTVPGAPGETGVEQRRNAAVTLVTGEIEKFTGRVDRHCGIFVLPAGPDGPPSATRQQIQTALRCMQQAKRQGRPAWAVWQVSGIDATAFAGVASSRFGDLHLVDTGSAPDDLSFRPCLLPRIAKDGAIVCRNQPVDASSLAKALDHFHDDVARSFGRAVAREVDRSTAALPAPAATPDETLRQQVTRGREALRTATGRDWPICPLHHDHALVLRDQQWFCDRDGAFVAPLGRLRRQRPARPLP